MTARPPEDLRVEASGPPTRWKVLLPAVAVLAILALVMANWETVWATLPGRVGAPEATLPLQARNDGEQPLTRLAVVGDVGTGEEDAWATARLVAETGLADPYDGLVLLGDNAYPDGDPTRLKATIFDPFEDVLATGSQLLPVLGNHDVRDGHAAGQVAGLGMPGRWYAAEIGPTLFIGLDSTLVDDADQRAWLEATLAASDSELVIAAMHHPAYSAGFHGSSKAVQEEWVPLFEEYEVELVLAGHDHDYQRSLASGGVTYVVSGAGAKVRATGRRDFTAYSASVLHFVEVGIWEDRIELRAISQDGVFDKTTLWSATAGDKIEE